MTSVRVTGIEWDTEVDGVITSPELPEALTILGIDVQSEVDWTDDDFDDAVGDAICDHLSYEYGYCVSSVAWDYL